MVSNALGLHEVIIIVVCWNACMHCPCFAMAEDELGVGRISPDDEI